MGAKRFAGIGVFTLGLVITLVLSGCSGKPKEQKVTPKPQKKTQAKPPSTPKLSEEPDQATFSQYFKNLSLGKVPSEWVNSKDWPFHIEDTDMFSRGDTMATQGEVIKDVQLTSKYYDVGAKKVIEGVGSSTPPMLKMGGFAGTSPVDLPVGNYELKLYVGDTLVSVLPFEVSD